MMTGRSGIYLILVVAVAAAIFIYTRGNNQIETEIVSVSSGDLQGMIDLETQVASFKGVPYAAAPIGDLRWAPPESAISWSGIRTAGDHGPNCVQQTGGNNGFIGLMMDGVGMPGWKKWIAINAMGFLPVSETSEDCLTLAVWAPADFDSPTNSPRAVMVWYHGGGHKFGAGDASQYDATKLAQRGVIVVSINYRLGVLGFMAHPELSEESSNASSGNYGTLDQIHALKWVNQNIHVFGGDPDNVTIFGESAGGHSVGQVMASPIARGLIHKAIAQSGIGTHNFATLEAAENAGVELAMALGISDENQIAALRALDAAELNAGFTRQTGLDILSHPVVDGWVFPKPAAAIFTADEQAPIPLMIGTNADEGTLLAPLFGTPFFNHFPGPQSVEEYNNMIAAEYPLEAGRLLELYPAKTDGELFDAINSLFGDHFFGTPAWFAAQKHSKSGYPTYVYFLTRTSPSPTQKAGAYHGADIHFVFGNFIPMFPKNDFDDELSRQVMDYWTDFAKTSNPNSGDLPDWESFDPNNPMEMELGQRVGMRPVERQENYELLATTLERYVTEASDAE